MFLYAFYISRRVTITVNMVRIHCMTSDIEIISSGPFLAMRLCSIWYLVFSGCAYISKFMQLSSELICKCCALLLSFLLYLCYLHQSNIDHWKVYMSYSFPFHYGIWKYKMFRLPYMSIEQFWSSLLNSCTMYHLIIHCTYLATPAPGWWRAVPIETLGTCLNVCTVSSCWWPAY